MDLDKKRELFGKAVEEAGFELKGKNNLYTSHGGHMFSFVGKDGIVGVRLAKEQLEEFLAQDGAQQPVQYNTVMKEYVEVDEDLLKDSKSLAKLLKDGFAYVDSLPKK